MKITHIFRNGVVLDDLTGVTVPAGHPVYDVIRGIQRGGKHEKDDNRARYGCRAGSGDGLHEHVLRG